MTNNEMEMKGSRKIIGETIFLRCRLWLLVLCGLVLRPEVLLAQRTAEDQALLHAQQLFDDHQYSIAESNLIRFVATYTNSPQLPYATLYLARSRLEQSNYTGALQKLTNAPAPAGDLAAEYAFWTASTLQARGDFKAAAERFAGFLNKFPDSPRQLQAAFNEAECYADLKEWTRVIDLLQKPDSVFARLAASAPKKTLVQRGRLMLAEAYLGLGNYGGGEKIAAAVDPAGLEPEWQWQRLRLLCHLELAGGRATEALQTSSNMLDTASGPRHVAASWFLRGQILESLGRTNEALQCYTNNLAVDLPPEYQWEALEKNVELTVAQNQIQDAVQFLENYIAIRTNSAVLDLARLSLGELYLKIHFTPAPVEKRTDSPEISTNYLLEALTNFDLVIQNYPSSPVLPRARLDRGWCYWTEAVEGMGTNMEAARDDFQIAADRMEFSPKQAAARFKLADSQLFLKQYREAVSNYNLILTQYDKVDGVTNELFDQALYQIIAASLARNDVDGAEHALKKILAAFPNSLFGDRGQLLIGESAKYDYAMVRREFSELLRRKPNTPYLAEAKYGIARTYEQEGNWPEAMHEYISWIAHYASNAPALYPQVEYSLGIVYEKCGMQSNSLALFTNFVTRFPTSPLAAWAQNWVADYYFNQGDYQSAEKNYEILYQGFTNPPDLGYHALLMAGRSALAGQRAAEASQYFRNLISISNAPADIKAQGCFALGDADLQQWQGNRTNRTYLDEAASAISNLTNGAPTNVFAARAYGCLGDYFMQWADLQWETNHDAKLYAEAAQMFQAVLAMPATNVDVATRSQAEVALGRVAERQGQTGQALNHYCNVFEYDPARFDPFWVEQAGVSAAQLYERQQQWDQAIKVYIRVQEAVPSLRPLLAKAIATDLGEANRARN